MATFEWSGASEVRPANARRSGLSHRPANETLRLVRLASLLIVVASGACSSDQPMKACDFACADLDTDYAQVWLDCASVYESCFRRATTSTATALCAEQEFNCDRAFTSSTAECLVKECGFTNVPAALACSDNCYLERVECRRTTPPNEEAQDRCRVARNECTERCRETAPVGDGS